jgi:hypothetical protein
MVVMLAACKAFVREFFDQNPLSQLGIIAIRDGIAHRLTDLAGTPEAQAGGGPGLPLPLPACRRPACQAGASASDARPMLGRRSQPGGLAGLQAAARGAALPAAAQPACPSECNAGGGSPGCGQGRLQAAGSCAAGRLRRPLQHPLCARPAAAPPRTPGLRATQHTRPPSPCMQVAKLSAAQTASGNASLQNALEMATEALASVPPYGHREVVILFAALSTCDPGNVWEAVRAAKEAKVRISVVGACMRACPGRAARRAGLRRHSRSLGVRAVLLLAGGQAGGRAGGLQRRS